MHPYSKNEIIKLLENNVGKTLGEADVNNVFDKTISNPKITGIAGDVVEQSIFQYPADNKQEADLIIDGIKTELKTTGLKYTKEASKTNLKFTPNKNNANIIEAKEPMSITAVSPEQIVNETFDNSNLWHKLENLLLVYYLYKSKSTVKASEYANFPIIGYQFHNFSNEDKDILMNDWLIVKNFISNVQEKNLDINTEYPKISKLRDKMLYMDTAPKFPNRPRFRLKRQVLTTIVQKFFGEKFIKLSGKSDFKNYSELNNILADFTKLYSYKSIEYISNLFNLTLKRNKKGIVSKAITEKILIYSFKVKTDHLRNIETFAKIGAIPKTLTLSPTGARTEDTKFDTIDFNEWTNPEISFESSNLYDYFANHMIIFSIFEEDYKNSPLEKNTFKGFKILSFDDDFIYTKVKPTWDEVRRLIWNNEFTVTPVIDKNGNQIINKKTGTVKEATNLPKSKDYDIFIRGTGIDANAKTEILQGKQIYKQQFWIKGSILVKLLDNIDFISSET